MSNYFLLGGKSYLRYLFTSYSLKVFPMSGYTVGVNQPALVEMFLPLQLRLVSVVSVATFPAQFPRASLSPPQERQRFSGPFSTGMTRSCVKGAVEEEIKRRGIWLWVTGIAGLRQALAGSIHSARSANETI